jgi:hypothetical protein
MLDHSKWDIPVAIIARNRAESYADEFDGDVERSLKEDTLPLFDQSPYEISDWASNNMNWSDVAAHATLVPTHPPKCDFEEGWSNGRKELVEKLGPAPTP